MEMNSTPQRPEKIEIPKIEELKREVSLRMTNLESAAFYPALENLSELKIENLSDGDVYPGLELWGQYFRHLNFLLETTEKFTDILGVSETIYEFYKTIINELDNLNVLISDGRKKGTFAEVTKFLTKELSNI